MKIRKNGKVISLTESDLRRIVRKVISEAYFQNSREEELEYLQGKLKDKKMVFRKYAISGENIGYAVFTNFLLFLLYLGISVYFKHLSVIALLFAFVVNVSFLMLTLRIMSRLSLKNRDI